MVNRIVLFIVLCVILFVICGLPYRIDVGRYVICSKKVDCDFLVCVLADLHCVSFGKNQEKLIDLIEKEKPDLVVIPGDLFDIDRDYENAFSLMKQLKGYPVCFTSGNHDMYLKQEIVGLRQRLCNSGVFVLEDEEMVLDISGNQLEIVGISDHGREMVYSVEQCNEMYQTDGYRILISHRPDYLSFYKEIETDLIICGHDHGGQWRIPFTHQGLIAPQKGFLPKYTEGIHLLGNHYLAISRGLASGNPHVPRLYNNPEIMMIRVQKDEKTV